MIKYFRAIFFVTICIISLPTFAQWEQINGDFGNSINDIHCADNVISVATDNGIYYSNSQGINWTKALVGLKSSIGFSTISHIGSYIFATGDSGLFSSSNYKTWKKNQGDFGKNMLCTKTVLVTYNNVSNSKIYISKDTGHTWKAQPWNGGNLVAASANTKNFFLGFSKFIGIITYTNNSWSQKPYFFPADTLNNRFLKAIDCNESYICAITSSNVDTMFLSDNSGKTWKVIPVKLPGYSWSQNNISAKVRVKLLDSNIVVTTPGGIFITYDKGFSWTKVMAGMQESTVNTICAGGDYIYIGVVTSAGKAKLYRRKCKDFNGITFNGGGMLEAPVSALSTYQWYFNDNIIPQAVDKVYNALSNGNYKVVIRNGENSTTQNAEKIISYSYSYYDIITSLSQEKSENDYYGESPEGTGRICIVSIQGQVIYEGQLTEPIERYKEKLVPGLYLFKYSENGLVKTFKTLVD